MIRAQMALAARVNTGKRSALLSDILGWKESGNRLVSLHVPPRFLTLLKLSRPNEAIDGMLEVMATTGSTCADRGLGCTWGTRLPATAPPLLLSHHTVDGPAFAALRAAGTAVWHFKAADLPGRTIFDPQGFSGWSSLATARLSDLPLTDAATAAAALAPLRQDIVARNTSKYAQGHAPVPDGPFVLIALQTVGDMVQRKAYLPMLEMLSLVCAHFAGTGLRVAVKRHPRCRDAGVTRALAALTSAPHVIQTDAPIHDLLGAAQALFTVNSGVGGEALFHTLPIYCFGAADYAPVAHQIRTPGDLAALASPLRPACSDADRLRFHHYYRETYQVARATGLRDRIDTLLDSVSENAR